MHGGKKKKRKKLVACGGQRGPFQNPVLKQAEKVHKGDFADRARVEGR